MKLHGCYKISLLSAMLTTALLGSILLVDARGMNGSVILPEGPSLDASSSNTPGNGLRSRQLQTPTKASSVTDDDTKETDANTDEDITTVNKSIASRTSSVVSSKKDLSSSVSVRFVKPETAAPTVAPPSNPPTPKPVVKKVPSSSNSTSIKPGPTDSESSSKTSAKTTSASSASTANTVPSRTPYPTTADPESIASKTATDGTPKVPLSDSMEFTNAETSPPNFTHTNYTQKAAEDSPGAPKNATEAENEDDDEDGYLPSNSTSSYSDDATVSPYTSTAAPKILYFTEQEQPENFPEMIGLLFVAAAFGFFAATALKNYARRREYEKIPESLTV